MSLVTRAPAPTAIAPRRSMPPRRDRPRERAVHPRSPRQECRRSHRELQVAMPDDGPVASASRQPGSPRDGLAHLAPRHGTVSTCVGQAHRESACRARRRRRCQRRLVEIQTRHTRRASWPPGRRTRRGRRTQEVSRSEPAPLAAGRRGLLSFRRSLRRRIAARSRNEYRRPSRDWSYTAA